MTVKTGLDYICLDRSGLHLSGPVWTTSVWTGLVNSIPGPVWSILYLDRSGTVYVWTGLVLYMSGPVLYVKDCLDRSCTSKTAWTGPNKTGNVNRSCVPGDLV